MAIVSIISSDEKDLTIEIIGIFSLIEQHEFMKTYANKDIESCTLNMNSALEIDASGLGFMLLLKDSLAIDAVISIIHCNPQIKEMLFLARFDKKFHIK